jgi:hypothetical protein
MGPIETIFKVLSNAQITLPMIELALLMIIMTACLLFQYTQTGLVVAYLFCYRWGMVFVQTQSQTIVICYIIFGSMVGILTVVGMFQNTE